MDLTIVPPKDGERLNLWALDQETHKPGTLIRENVAVGEVQIDDGTDTVRRDLYFFTTGNVKGTSHIAFWQNGGVYRRPTFVVVDIWKEDITLRVMESAGTKTYLTGTCTH